MTSPRPAVNPLTIRPRLTNRRPLQSLVSILLLTGPATVLAFSSNCPLEPQGTWSFTPATPFECTVIITKPTGFSAVDPAQILFRATQSVTLNTNFLVGDQASFRVEMLENVCSFTCAGQCHTNSLGYCN